MMKKIIFIIAVIGLACIFLIGCESDENPQSHGLLPINAQVVKRLGNDWMIFEIEGRQYIYRSRMRGANAATEVLAPWSKDPE